MRWYLIAIFLTLSCLAKAQENTFNFEAKLVDSETGEPIRFASIVVTNRGKGMASDQKGEFSFQAQIGDELKITSIGYHDFYLVITTEQEKAQERIPLFMDSRTYVLDSVTVIQMRDDFYLKKPVWDTMKIDNPYLNTVNPTDWSKINYFPNTDGTAGGSITGLLNTLTKDYKQQKKLKKLEASIKFKEKRKAEIEAIFTKKFVKRVTRIDDRVIDEFMEFCDFRDGIILNSSEYELTLQVLKKYKEFLRR